MTTVATWNVGSRSDDKVLGGLDRLAERAAAFGLQECGDRGKVLRRFIERHNWRLWDGDAPGSTSTPILWNPKALEATHCGTTRATPATFAGRGGAGPSVVKAKVWQRVRFVSDIGPFVFIDGHLPASLYLARRRELAARQVDVLEQVVRRRKGRVPVVAVMDANSKPDDRLWDDLRQLGMTQHTRDATHGRRCIDLTWTLGVGGRANVIDMPSDHNAVLLTLKEK